MNNNRRLPPRTIMYIGDLCNADKEELDKIDLDKIEIREAKLYCMVCSSCQNITRENFKTLSVDHVINTHPPLLIFKYCTSYGGKCLLPGCVSKFKPVSFYDILLDRNRRSL